MAKGVITPQRVGFLFRANLVVLLLIVYHIVMMLLPVFTDMDQGAMSSTTSFGSPMMQLAVRLLCIVTLIGCVVGSYFDRWDVFLGMLFINALILVFSLGDDLNALQDVKIGPVDYRPPTEYYDKKVK